MTTSQVFGLKSRARNVCILIYYYYYGKREKMIMKDKDMKELVQKIATKLTLIGENDEENEAIENEIAEAIW